MRHFRRAPNRIAVTVSDTVSVIDEIQMRVYVHKVNGLLITKRLDARYMDGMIATQYDWQGIGFQYCANSEFNIVVALYRISVDDIGVPDINQLDLVRWQVDFVIFEVICTIVAK
jgi:hypothetical protein